jgi:hypothetical protein
MASLIPFVALLAIGGWPTTFPHFRIALALDPKLTAAVARHAVDEAGTLWAPYGVAIVQRNALPAACGSAGRVVDAVLTVDVAEPRPDTSRAWSSPFASIRFVADGQPEPAILLHYDAVIRLGLGTVSLAGAREPRWPSAVRDRVLGRIIGRVVAHEIGHWLLRSKDHSTIGLMRANHSTDALANPGRGDFALSRADFARLQAALTR